ncbi:MAG: hydantoinase B/oxoprolinase family protein [Desulfobacterales bacterium]|nr:hydantoinase B/oxoprolinase family protein [Desulfobacterales bacterium]
MAAVLGRTALSPNIKERKDYLLRPLQPGAAKRWPRARTSRSTSGPCPSRSRRRSGPWPFETGDLVILNDPYRGGTHLPDITCISPVFLGGKLAFFVANRAHHSDVGGMTPGSMPLATELFQEGLIIPPLKLVRRGRLNRGRLRPHPGQRPDARRAARRPPGPGRGQRHRPGADRRGGGPLRRRTRSALYAGLIQDYSESIPAPDAARHPRRRIRVRGPPRRRRDLRSAPSASRSGSRSAATGRWSISPAPRPRRPGGVNANFAITCSAVLYVFRCLVEEDIPFNTGLMRPLDDHRAPGLRRQRRVPGRLRPAGNVETSQRIVDVLLGALAKAHRRSASRPPARAR